MTSPRHVVAECKPAVVPEVKPKPSLQMKTDPPVPPVKIVAIVVLVGIIIYSTI